MKEVTIVTALFNINRENMDGRSWNEYLQWFNDTLKLNCAMVIFTTEDMVSFIKERRLSIPTKIITQKLEEIPYYHLKDKLDNIIDSVEYKQKISDPDRIECKHSIYSIIQYSKFEWLKTVIGENIFNSKFFFWMDAGASKFFDDCDFSLEYPSQNAVEALEKMGNKFLIQMNMECYPDLANADTLSEDYLFDNRSYILGSMFGGTENATLKVITDVKYYLKKMITEGYINNEQILLGYLVKKNVDHYEVYERYDGKHLSLFVELGKR